MLCGYVGKMLFVDLTTGKMEEKELPDELVRNFIGGYGIGAKILYDMMPAGADPLGPENVLGFITGPVNGAGVFFGGRYTIVHKSPVSGGWSDANSGGFFGPELKKSGFDAVFVYGAAKKPVYLWINEGKAELRDASHLWGKDSKETWDALKEETGEPKVRVVAIGPAGENLSLISCPINDGHRAPARGGGGAVMGSKNLKAIAVRGTKVISVADPERVKELNKRISDNMKESQTAKHFGAYGTGAGTQGSALNGDSPVKNWRGVGITDYGEERSGHTTATELLPYVTKKYACANCPMGCGASLKIETGRWPLAQTDRPEYETAAAFGCNLLCDDVDVLLKCNEICNTYGFDTISAGMTVAWAMECYNNGVLSREELDGIDLTWGNGEAIVAIMQKMADAEGCGAILTNGSAYAAKTWGKGSEYLCVASGIELAMHDPRWAPGLARTYQYDPSPGRHVKGGLGVLQMAGTETADKYDYNNTGDSDARITASVEITNCGGFCYMQALVSPREAQNEYIEAVTGMPFSNEDGFRTGLRILAMRQAFNVREGIKPSDCDISRISLGEPPLTEGPVANVTVDAEKLARSFFTAVEWDMETGKPSLDSLKKLGSLDEVIRDCYEMPNSGGV